MLLIEKRSLPTMHVLTPAAFFASPATTATTTATTAATTAATTTTRKRKVVAASVTEKRARRSWSELAHEEMLAEATLLREELELLVMVAADLCADLACDAATARGFAALLARHEQLLAQDVTLRQMREMTTQMAAMMQYLCRTHDAHFALVDMQDQLRACRDRFMRFVCQYAAMLGL